MKIVYKYSKINNDLMDYATPHNRKPTINEIRKAIKNDNYLLTDDNLYILTWGGGCEVRKVIKNRLSTNRYNDIYYFI